MANNELKNCIIIASNMRDILEHRIEDLNIRLQDYAYFTEEKQSFTENSIYQGLYESLTELAHAIETARDSTVMLRRS